MIVLDKKCIRSKNNNSDCLRETVRKSLKKKAKKKKEATDSWL